MAPTEILCLANSKKHGGRCLAGLSWPDLQTWIRPVERAREHGEIPSNRAQVDSPEGRRWIRPLDVINVDLIEPAPTPAQPENWILGSSPITLVRTLDIAEAASLLSSVADTSSSLFDLGGSKSIPESVASLGLPKSIDLYEVQAPSFKMDNWDKWRTEFQYGNHSYSYLSVTDLDVLDRLNQANHRRVTGAGCWFLTISLTEPWHGSHWFAVAAAIRGGSEMPRPPVGREPF